MIDTYLMQTKLSSEYHNFPASPFNPFDQSPFMLMLEGGSQRKPFGPVSRNTFGHTSHLLHHPIHPACATVH